MVRLPKYNWARLERRAIEIVEDSIQSLPVELKNQAANIPVVYRKWHPDVKVGDPSAVEFLGEYLSYEDDRLGEQKGPIILYLGAIQLFCEEEKDATFEEETRITYLHELGHHFGWDEIDLESRGLA